VRPLAKVDEALGQVGVGALEIEDDRRHVLEAVGHLLGVVEGLRHHEVHPHVPDRPAVASAGHRPQLGRAPLGRGVVGEDVVDLVAPAAAREAPDVRTFAIAVLASASGSTPGDALEAAGTSSRYSS
jgi:hypothetical protein